MGKYENGVETRKIILEACKKLFYEKGYHETSNEDICQAAHVNRSAIHYHFKDKENIRYEVLWENAMKNRHFAGQYCDQEQYLQLLAVYLMHYQYLNDPKSRKFFADYHRDFPLYSSSGGMAQFYRISYESMYGQFLEFSQVKSLAFQSAYTFICGVMLLADEHPEHYTPKELFSRCMISGMAILDIPTDKINRLWEDLERYIDRLPSDAIDASLL